MHIQKLPTYSCERYYLLSEIEQRAEFVFIDEPNRKITERRSTQNPRIDSIFLLWDASRGFGGLKENIREILGIFPSCQNRCIIVVDCLVASEKEFESKTKDELEDFFSWSQTAFPDSFIFVGISDKASGMPGLEKLCDFMEFAVSCAPAVTGNIRLIGKTRQDCLGHDPDREPDAVSDVFQVLCSRSVEAQVKWEKEFKDYVQQLYGVHDSDSQEKSSTTHYEHENSQRWGITPFLVLLAVFGVVAAVVWSYYDFLLMQFLK